MAREGITHSPVLSRIQVLRNVLLQSDEESCGPPTLPAPRSSRELPGSPRRPGSRWSFRRVSESEEHGKSRRAGAELRGNLPAPSEDFDRTGDD